MNIQLGIIGYGGMGEIHSKHAPGVEGVQIAAACDIKQNRLELIRERGFKCYDSADKLLADDSVNTVLLTVPNYLHKEMAVKAAKAGKNIICEKPVAINVAELEEMVKAAKENNIIFTVHQNRRWDRDFQIVKKAYEQKLMGNVFTVESCLHSANGFMHEWHLYKKYGGGMMYDWGVHLLDQILYMFPEQKVLSVYADLKNVLHEEVDDYFKILLKLDNGITVHVELSTYILKPKHRWIVAGDRGTLYINSFACDGAIVRTSEKLNKLPPSITESVAGPTRQFAPLPAGVLYEDPLPESDASWLEFYKNFVKVINNEAEQAVKITEVHRVLRLMEAVFKSSESNETVLFE